MLKLGSIVVVHLSPFRLLKEAGMKMRVGEQREESINIEKDLNMNRHWIGLIQYLRSKGLGGEKEKKTANDGGKVRLETNDGGE